MPNLEEHCKHSLKRYKIEGKEIHIWLDEPCRIFAGSHRQFRHDTETIMLAGNIFDKKYGRVITENIALDHITMDHRADIEKRNIRNAKSLEEQKGSEAEKKEFLEKKRELRKELKEELKHRRLKPILPPIKTDEIRVFLDRYYSHKANSKRIANIAQDIGKLCATKASFNGRGKGNRSFY